MTTKPLHTITLDREAARWLGALIGGALGISPSKDPAVLVRVGAFADSHLSDIGDPPEVFFSAPLVTDSAELLKSYSENMKAHRAALKAWQREKLPAIEFGEKTRDALKAILKDASAAGHMTGSSHHTQLLTAFGLAPEDG